MVEILGTPGPHRLSQVAEQAWTRDNVAVNPGLTTKFSAQVNEIIGSDVTRVRVSSYRYFKGRRRWLGAREFGPDCCQQSPPRRRLGRNYAELG